METNLATSTDWLSARLVFFGSIGAFKAGRAGADCRYGKEGVSTSHILWAMHIIRGRSTHYLGTRTPRVWAHGTPVPVRDYYGGACHELFKSPHMEPYMAPFERTVTSPYCVELRLLVPC